MNDQRLLHSTHCWLDPRWAVPMAWWYQRDHWRWGMNLEQKTVWRSGGKDESLMSSFFNHSPGRSLVKNLYYKQIIYLLSKLSNKYKFWKVENCIILMVHLDHPLMHLRVVMCRPYSSWTIMVSFPLQSTVRMSGNCITTVGWCSGVYFTYIWQRHYCLHFLWQIDIIWPLIKS